MRGLSSHPAAINSHTITHKNRMCYLSPVEMRRNMTGDRQKSGLPLNILQGLNLPDLTQSPYTANIFFNTGLSICQNLIKVKNNKCG